MHNFDTYWTWISYHHNLPSHVLSHNKLYGAPTSTVGRPAAVDTMGPMVNPHPMSCLTTNSLYW